MLTAMYLPDFVRCHLGRSAQREKNGHPIMGTLFSLFKVQDI